MPKPSCEQPHFADHIRKTTKRRWETHAISFPSPPLPFPAGPQIVHQSEDTIREGLHPIRLLHCVLGLTVSPRFGEFVCDRLGRAWPQNIDDGSQSFSHEAPGARLSACSVQTCHVHFCCSTLLPSYRQAACSARNGKLWRHFALVLIIVACRSNSGACMGGGALGGHGGVQPFALYRFPARRS